MFNHPSHLSLQGEHHRLHLIRKDNHRIYADVAFFIDHQRAFSPLRAPFGSFQFADQLPPKLLYDFVKYAEDWLVKKGVTQVVITDAPLHYRKNGEMLQAILFNLGYSVSRAELSTGIPVDSHHFEDKIETWEKRKLRQARDKGAQFKAIPLSDLDRVYDFIHTCRTQRDQKLSMTLDELRNTIMIFKDEFQLFGVFIQKELTAASISIRVRKDVLYNFYSAHHKKYDAISPVVLMLSGMYRNCYQQHIKLIDLGTSAIDGQPNFPLLDFKLRLGGIPSMKLTFQKKLQ